LGTGSIERHAGGYPSLNLLLAFALGLSKIGRGDRLLLWGATGIAQNLAGLGRNSRRRFFLV
jgi:hypothetical protein